VTLRSALLSFRIQRFETAIIIGATVLSVVVSAIVIALFTRGGYADCLSSDGPVFTATCQSFAARLLPRIAQLSVQIVPFFPVVAGLLAGGPIVARELESGTARLAWSLGPSRRRWFAQRAVPILGLVLLAGLAIGLTSGALTHVLTPAADLDRSFLGFRARGVLVGIEAVLIAAIALAFGALVGRLVPTLILTLILLFGLAIAIDKVDRTLLTSEAQLASGESFSWDTDYFLENRVKFADGTVMTYEEAFQTRPELMNGWEGDTPPYTDLVVYIPGARYQDVERREAVALGALAIGFIALAAFVVGRRRPR
jgi:hypothetical protein